MYNDLNSLISADGRPLPLYPCWWKTSPSESPSPGVGGRQLWMGLHLPLNMEKRNSINSCSPRFEGVPALSGGWPRERLRIILKIICSAGVVDCWLYNDLKVWFLLEEDLSLWIPRNLENLGRFENDLIIREISYEKMPEAFKSNSHGTAHGNGPQWISTPEGLNKFIWVNILRCIQLSVPSKER